jgi:TPP-dependent pyruvate/acetoin dehydrogenase alpha subunit
MKSYQGDGNDVFEVYEITKMLLLESKKNKFQFF